MAGAAAGLALVTGAVAQAAATPQVQPSSVVTQTPGQASPSPAGSPAPAARRLTLDEALQEAVHNSPDLAQAQARVAQTRAQVQEVLAGMNPTLTFTPTYLQTEPPVTLNFGGQPTEIVAEHNYQLPLTLNQTIATFGRLHWHVQAARLNVKATEEDYRSALDQLVDQVTTDYLQALLAEENVSIAQETVAVDEVQLKDTQSLLAAGMVARFDLLQTQTTLTEARQTLLVAQNSFNLAEATLLSAIGEATNQSVTLAPVDTGEAPQQTRDAGLAHALSHRPELVSLDWAIRSGEALVYWIADQKNPDLALTSTYSVHNQVGFAATPNQWNTGLSLAVPILDGGLAHAQVQEAQQQVKQLQAQRGSVARTVELQVQSAWLALQNDWERTVVAQEQVRLAEESRRVAEVRYQAGYGTNLERLQASQSVTVARVSLANARFQYAIEQSHWRRAIAGDLPAAIPGGNKE